jgi:predicted metalloprotease
MKWEGREESENVEDRRGMMGGTGGMVAGGGGIVVLLIALFLGVNPAKLSQFLGQGSPAPGGQAGQGGGAVRAVNPEEEKLADFTKIVFRDTELVWDEQFKQMGQTYVKPKLVLFSGQVQSACGQADAAVGPFYCGGDRDVYIDLAFYLDLQRNLNAPGDFARAYVVAHEVGHHVQALLGYAEKAHRAEQEGDKVEAHHMSVRLELQADYLAGVWAFHAQEKFHYLEKGDLETALKAAFEIGDDRLQKKARGTVVPDSFTHGTSNQRMFWFNKGFSTGDVKGAAALFDLPYEKL